MSRGDIINPNNEKHAARLHSAVRTSYKLMGDAREHRKDALMEYTGRNYGKRGGRTAVPMPLIKLYLTILIPRLVSRAPTPRISSTFSELKFTAWKLTQATQDAAKRLQLAQIFQAVTKDALISPCGILKIGLAPSIQREEYEGEDMSYGDLFVCPVSFNDYIVDMKCADYHKRQFEGNQYRISLEDALESEMLKGARDRMKPDQDSPRNPQASDERAAMISTGGNMEEDAQDHIILQDIYLPRERMIVTYFANGDPKPVNIMDYEGPQEGPYRTLQFDPVPDQVLALPPVATLMDMHKFINDTKNKTMAQARRAKEQLHVVGATEQEIVGIESGADGSSLALGPKCDPKPWRVGGPLPELELMLQSDRQTFSWLAGNMDSLGGLSPQSGTATQDQLLSAASSVPVEYMQQVVGEFAKGVMRTVAEYVYSDPTQIYVSEFEDPELPGVKMPIEFTPEQRTAPFFRMNFDIDLYSMQNQTPEKQYQTLMGWLNAMAPFIPIGQQQGATLDVAGLMRYSAELAQLKELKQFVKFEAPPEGGPRNVNEASPAMPQKTQRTTIRKNVSNPSNEGHGKMMAQALAASMGGGKTQPRQMAQLSGGQQ